MSMRTEHRDSLRKLGSFGRLHLIDPVTYLLDKERHNRLGMAHDLIARALEWDDAAFAFARIVTTRGEIFEPAEMEALAAANDICPGILAGPQGAAKFFAASGDGGQTMVRVTRPALETFAGADKDASIATIINLHSDAIEGAAQGLFAEVAPAPDGEYLMTREWLASRA